LRAQGRARNAAGAGDPAAGRRGAGVADVVHAELRLARRAGMAKAKVALARKLAVIMHRMLVEGKPFNSAAAAN